MPAPGFGIHPVPNWVHQTRPLDGKCSSDSPLDYCHLQRMISDMFQDIDRDGVEVVIEDLLIETDKQHDKCLKQVLERAR